MKVIFTSSLFSAVVPAASVATAVDLGGEEGGAPPAKRSSRSAPKGAVCAEGALAGDPERKGTTWSSTIRNCPGA